MSLWTATMMNHFPRSNCILANIFVAFAILLFAAGFFPHKAFIPGLAAWPTDREISPIGSPFDKVIFMVVDALRRYLHLAHIASWYLPDKYFLVILCILTNLISYSRRGTLSPLSPLSVTLLANG